MKSDWRHKCFAIGNIEMGGRGAEVAKTADLANDFVNDCSRYISTVVSIPIVVMTEQ